MHSTFALFATGVLAFTTSVHAQTCSAPPFYNNPNYGVKSGCIPTSYNSASDLGNTNPTDAATRCAQQCSRAANCGGWAAQLNKAADSGLYSGQCFLYTTLPASPRACADKPSELVAGVRDDSAKCFASSASAATAFCSSFLGIGEKTVTNFAPTPTVTATTTATTVIPSTSTTVASVLETTTVTGVTVTDITVVTLATTTTSTTTVAPVATTFIKRAVLQPACLASGIPSAQLTEDCKCLRITSKTVTTLATPAAVTVSATTTATTVQPVVETQSTFITVTIQAVATTKTTTSVTETRTEVATATACVPSVPSGNVLVNPGFNDGSFNGWNPGGNGAFADLITSDAQCGPSGASFTVSSSNSYGRIGQRFTTLDRTKRYRIQTYVKRGSGDPTNCYYYVTCQKPGSFSSADNVIIQTTVSSLATVWTQLNVDCPANANELSMSLSLQCNQGKGPVTIGIDEIAMYPFQQIS
ncbi:hypothetical protein DE146DRAFT_754777 [Phaeosphaeria sp. MPI-PUGE-AT-0046c]|nr:hypothetical protein DE146DRAFT_754777 [Phaeosphaeria sp. MPI-PUGE-AT-0046c]